MAIGNNNNQNLFGTNYNSEEEKRKQAELAAQNARIGAGGVPAAAVGQTPGVNPFSLKKRNPKFGSGETLYRGATGMEDIAGIQGVPQGGTLDPTQGARDLLIGRQFNRGEPIRISDMGSLIQAPQEVPQSAFGQAPAVSPFSMEAAGQVNPMMEQQSLEVPPQALPKPTPTDIIGTFDNPESPQVNSAQANFLARKEEGGSLTVKELKDAEAFAASMGTTFNRITGYSREAFQAAQDAKLNPLMTGLRPIDPRTGEAIINPETGKPFSQAEVERLKAAGMTSPLPQASVPLPQAPQAQAPMGQEETRAALGGMTLNEYLNAPPVRTPGISGLKTDPQGRMIPNVGQFQEQPNVAQPPVNGAVPPATAQPPAAALSSFEQASLERQQRIGGTGSYEGDSQAMQDRLRADQAMSDRDRRAARGDDISMADQTAMAKANDRNATPREVARGNQVANALGVDLRTGQPLQQGLTFEQQSEQATSELELADQNGFNTSITGSTSPEGVVNYNQALNEYVRGGGSNKGYLEFLRKGQELEQKARDAGRKPEIKVIELDGFKVITQDGRYMTGTTIGGDKITPSAILTLRGRVDMLADAEKDYFSGDPERIKRAERTITALGIKGDFGAQLSAEKHFGIGRLTNAEDAQAYIFAIDNPNDPRSQAILNRLKAN